MTLEALKQLDPSDAIDFAVEVLDVIGELAGSATASNAADIVMAIRHIYNAVTGVGEGKVTPDEVRAELDKFRRKIATTDAAIDNAIDETFDASNKEG